jgi:hypothetical protein
MLVLDVVPAKHAYLVPTSTGHKVFVLEEAHRKKMEPRRKKTIKAIGNETRQRQTTWRKG